MKKLLLLMLSAMLIALSSSAAFAGSQDFTLVNNSRSAICYVYVSANNSSSWEEDILGADQCLDPGESLKISFNAGNQAIWDLRVEDNNGNYEDYMGFNLNQISVIRIQGNGEATYQ